VLFEVHQGNVVQTIVLKIVATVDEVGTSVGLAKHYLQQLSVALHDQELDVCHA